MLSGHMKQVGIIGHGYVGKAVEQFFSKKFKVVLYDPPQGYKDKKALQKVTMIKIILFNSNLRHLLIKLNLLNLFQNRAL